MIVKKMMGCKVNLQAVVVIVVMVEEDLEVEHPYMFSYEYLLILPIFVLWICRHWSFTHLPSRGTVTVRVSSKQWTSY